MHVIYCILNLENGKHYVGSAINFKARKAIHIHHLNNKTHHNVKLQNSWNKRSEVAFRFDVLETVSDKNILIEREQFWINETLPFYNICRTAGSRLGYKFTDAQLKAMSETSLKFYASDAGVLAKKKMSEVRKGRVTSLETKEKLRQRFVGIKLSAEHSAKISASLKGKPGRKLSDAEKKNLSEKFAGRKLTPEHIEKIKLARVGFKHTTDSITYMRDVKRKFNYKITSPDGEVYISDDVKGFSKIHGLGYQSMYRVARGVLKHHKNWLISKIEKETEAMA